MKDLEDKIELLTRQALNSPLEEMPKYYSQMKKLRNQYKKLTGKMYVPKSIIYKE